MLDGAPGAAWVGTVTVALALAVRPSAAVPTNVKVVVALTVTLDEPESATALPLIAADAALVVCHVTVARLLAPNVAVICAVGAETVVGVTVALAEAVWPTLFFATKVKVVWPVTVIVLLPARPTPEPLMVADVALPVCQVTVAALLAPMAAVICADGAAAGDTEALAVATWPVALRAVSVNVVGLAIVTVVEPDNATPVPLIDADVALPVCHVTVATLFAPRVAVI